MVRIISYIRMFLIWQLVDPKTGEEKKVVISDDDGIRPGTSLADLSKLKTVFKKSGSTTAGTLHHFLKHKYRSFMFVSVIGVFVDRTS